MEENVRKQKELQKKTVGVIMAQRHRLHIMPIQISRQMTSLNKPHFIVLTSMHCLPLFELCVIYVNKM